MKFDRCILKPVSRNVQYISFYARIFKKPLKDMRVSCKILKNLKLFKKILLFTNVLALKIRFEFMKRANGWKPFLYNLNLRCDKLKKINPLTKIIWKWINDLTNLNNSCPYNVNKKNFKKNTVKQIIYIPNAIIFSFSSFFHF